MGKCKKHGCDLQLEGGYCPTLYCPQCVSDKRKEQERHDTWADEWPKSGGSDE